MTTELFNINLTQTQKIALRRRAALMTAESGKLITMSDLVRNLIDELVASPITESSDTDKSSAIKFTPLPHVAKALKQARFNSGKPVSEIVNEMLVEALQNEGISL
jgi:hypothetical protein